MSTAPLLQLPVATAVRKVAWPMVATGLLKSCYFLTDSYFIGQLGPAALAAVGGSAFAWWIVVQLTDLPGTGIHSMVAQHEGAGDRDRIPHTASQGIWTSLAIWLALVITVLPNCHLYFDLLGFSPDGEPYALGVEYLSASILGAGTLALVSVVNAAFRGVGDTMTGMYIGAVMALLNVALDPLLIWGLGPIPAFGIAGAAWATALANFLGAMIGGAILARRGLVLTLGRMDFPVIGRMTKIGTPVAMSGIGFSIIYVFLGRIINPFGEHHMAALGIGHRLEGLAFMVTVGFMVGASTMVGQYVGARDTQGAREAASVSARMCSTVMLPAGLMLFAFAEPLFRIFTDDPVLIEAGAIYLRVQTPVLIFMGLEMVYEGAFTGVGNTMPSFWVTAIGTAARIPIAIAFVEYTELGVVGIWVAIALTTLLKGTTMMVWFHRSRWEQELQSLPAS